MAYQATTPVSDVVGIVQCGSIPLRIQRAAAALTASGSTTVIPAPPAAYKIVVLSMHFSLQGTGGTKFYFLSHTTTTQASGAWYSPQYSMCAFPHNPGGWFECVPGEALDINSSASVIAGAIITYVLVPISQWEA